MEYKFDKLRPLSWSAISSFENPDNPKYSSPEKWFDRYILNIKEEPNAELKFGSFVDKKIQNDKTFLPELERFPIMQYKIEAEFKKIPLIGFADGIDFYNFRLKDDKTGKSEWNQERADKTGQITFYLAMLFLSKKIKPEQWQCQIDWIPTQKNGDFSIDFVRPIKIYTFKTKRTLLQILKFLSFVEKTQKKMIAYCKKRNIIKDDYKLGINKGYPSAKRDIPY